VLFIQGLMKEIEVIDDFLSDILLDDANAAIGDSKWLHEGHSVGGLRFWHCELSKQYKFIKKVMSLVEKRYGDIFDVHRVYANGQTYGQDGSFHQDHEDDNAYTLLIYVSEITPGNVDSIGGFTQIKMKDGIINIEPYVKRAVMFKSNLYHRGLAPGRLSGILRQTIAFKLFLNKLSKLKQIKYI
jgi:hypothetical protein